MTPERSSEVARDPEKTARWESELSRVEQIRDGLGRKVDEGIKETVVAFLTNEFPVRGSCEGHIEERSGKMTKISPYVDIGLEAPKRRYVGEEEIKKTIAEQFDIAPDDVHKHADAQKAYWDHISANDTPETPEYKEVRIKNEDLKKEAEALIDEFYSQRPQERELLLNMHNVGPTGSFKVEGVQGFVHDVSEEGVAGYRETLLKEQEDMAALTEFLKKRFFEGGSG